MLRKFLGLLIGLFTSIVASAQLTIIVDKIPNNTPGNDAIYIAGDFQGWNPGDASYILTKDTSLNRYQITLAAGTGDILFKFTRGSWPKVESTASGAAIPNRSYSGAEGDTIYLQILGWEDLNGNGGGQSTAASNVSILSDSFYMPQLDRYRRIWLYLPPDYGNTNYSYPVLYMHDGQNVFDAHTSFSGEWQVDETLNALHANGDTGIIVVAIDNGQNFRIEEYTPWTNTTYGGGRGAAYIDFIVDDLKPFIDSNYRTLSDREHTGILGSSLGGLVSTYAGIEHQEVFSKVGAFSPAYWINPEAYAHVSASGKQENMRIYQIGGSNEGSNMIQNLRRMNDTLHLAGFGADELMAIEKADGQHSEWFWAREFEAAYLWLYSNPATSNKPSLPNHKDFRLYPNPAKEQIRLEFSLQHPSETQVEIYDSLGTLFRTVYYIDRLPPGEQQITLDIGDWGLAPGLYLCKLIVGRESTTLKFVVTK